MPFWFQGGPFLGHVVLAKGVHADPNKIRAVSELQEPRNESFLGLAGHYRWFIPQFQWRRGSTLARGAPTVLAPSRKLRLFFVVQCAMAIERYLILDYALKLNQYASFIIPLE